MKRERKGQKPNLHLTPNLKDHLNDLNTTFTFWPLYLVCCLVCQLCSLQGVVKNVKYYLVLLSGTRGEHANPTQKAFLL